MRLGSFCRKSVSLNSIARPICKKYNHIVCIQIMLFYDVSRVSLLWQKLSLMVDIQSSIVETYGGNCFRVTASNL